MAITRIIRHEAVGETLGLAMADDTPAALFIDLWDEPQRLRICDQVDARLEHRTPDGRAAFLSGPGGDALFMERAPHQSVSIGQSLPVRVVSEARREKSARVVAAKPATGKPDGPFDAWRVGLACETGCTVETTDDPTLIHDALDTALAPSITLPGGGRLTIERTRALTAADIDTAGRRDKGRAADRALIVNTAAALTLAQHLSLRSLGGLVVLDCVSPIAPPHRPALKSAFLAAFKAWSTRKIEALAPSPLGLMEIAAAWTERPIDEAFLNADGTAHPRSTLLGGLRLLEREARADRSASLSLHLPESAYQLFLKRQETYVAALNDRYGARLEVCAHNRPGPEVTHAKAP